MDEPLAIRMARLEEQVGDMHTDIHEVKTDVRELNQKLVGRPSWGVVAALTFLSSLCVGLIVAIATGVAS